MADINRTAYPQFADTYTKSQLARSFTPSEDEIVWVKRNVRSRRMHLGAMTLLKSFQALRYFPTINSVPASVVHHIGTAMGMHERLKMGSYSDRTLHRHMKAIRDYLKVTAYYGNTSFEKVMAFATEAAAVVHERRDIINSIIERLVLDSHELPAFSTLENAAEEAHAQVLGQMYDKVMSRIDSTFCRELDALLVTDFERRVSSFNDLKFSAKRLSRQNMDALIEHLQWLEGIGNIRDVFQGVPDAKVEHLASQARAFDASAMRECAEPKRYTMLLALIQRMQMRARDQLTEMLVRRVKWIEKKAREEKDHQLVRNRDQVAIIAASLAGVIEILDEERNDERAGARIRQYVSQNADLKTLSQTITAFLETAGGSHFNLMLKHFRAHRAILFRVVGVLKLCVTSQDSVLASLMDALALIKTRQNRHGEQFIDNVDLSFTTRTWRELISVKVGDKLMVNARVLEVCVFHHLVEALESGDIAVVDADEFGDYRKKLLPWEECLKVLPQYCERVGLPDNAKDFVADLKKKLHEAADAADDYDPHHEEDFSITSHGDVIVRRTPAREIPDSAIALQAEIERQMPQRHVLDVLANIEHLTNFTRYFGPISGNEPKLGSPEERYLTTVFAMGTALGPTQASRHMANRSIRPESISYVNNRHVTVEKLERALREINEVYLELDLPKAWGDGRTIAADGSQMDMYVENLMAGYHFRYRKLGAVAYRHVANNYIAVFRHFIAPGVWEAVMVIEGLMKAQLSVEADTVHSDTQGQSAAVFTFTYLRGIALMPRIRNWKELAFYRPDPAKRYKSINKLFRRDADWNSIESNWQELMQISLSIERGMLSSPLLLRRLGTGGRRNRLFLATQATGNVIRSIFLLRWIADREMRQDITATTNKQESYHGFSDWVDFGGDVVVSNEPEEQQKRLRYNDLMCSAIILHNVADMILIRRRMEKRQGITIREKDLSFLSPYATAHLKRFGEYALKLKRPPEAWIAETTFRDAAHAARLRERARQGEAVTAWEVPLAEPLTYVAK